MNTNNTPKNLVVAAFFIFFGFSEAAQADRDFHSSTAFEAVYRVSFVSKWSQKTHPTGFPADPHFSGLVGLVHNSKGSLWSPGKLASPGMESMAETGRKATLLAEGRELIAQGEALRTVSGNGTALSPGRASIDIVVNQDFPLVSLVSMIAPSPDWFVGVSSLSLREGDDWVASKAINLALYDSGTDDGRTFAYGFRNTNPQQPIRRLTSRSHDTDFIDGKAYVGQFVFEKIK